MGSASPLGSCVSSVNTSSSVARPRLCTENPEARNLTPAKTWFTLVLDYPRPARDSRGFRYVAERSHSRFTTLGSFSGCAADGARNSLHILRPARCGHSQDPLRLPWPRGYGVLAGRVRRARAAPPGASDVGRSRPGCISCRRALRVRPRGDELLALPGHRPHTPWRRRYPRVPGSPRCGRRRLPPDARPAMGLARRDRYPAARAPRYVRGTGLVLALCVGTLLLFPFGIAGAVQALLDPRLLLAAFGVAMLSTAIPFSLDLEALRKIPARIFGVLMSLEPAVAALAGLVVLGERLEMRAVAAVLLVTIAAAGASLYGRHEEA